MKNSENPITSILGVDVRTKHKIDLEISDECSFNPIIHKQIHGDEVYVPLNLSSIWSTINRK